METLQNLLYGLSVANDPMNLLYCLVGVLFGTLVGALPGLGPAAGIAVLLPLTFGANPISGIIMLTGIYYGAMYGGSITSILINTPGDSAAVMTTLDGYPLAKKGRAAQALGMAAFASIIGGTISVIAFMFLAPALAIFAIRFGPPEYFALMILGLTTIAGMTGKYPSKGFISALVGLFFATVGLDLMQGIPRFTFGSVHLYEGLDFIPVAMGLFGIAEILTCKTDECAIKIEKKDVTWRKLLPSKEDWKYSLAHIFRSTGIGFFIGMLPGAGATISSFISYGVAKKTSKRGEEFGKGVIEGVAAPEASNNAASIGALVPMLTLGVPGSGSTAIMLGALMMFGLRPGPMLFEHNPDFVWGLIGSMYIGNIFLLILAILAVPLFIKILNVPRPILNATVMSFILIGSYSLNNSMFDVGLTIGFGALGFFMKKMDYPAAPMVLALVLGILLETSLRQSMIISGGNPMIFFTRPVSGSILGISILAIFYPLIKKAIQSYQKSRMA
ncbi:tripartite tricarboxylate transporter permease [Desulfosporosinus shakirovi]|uniref:tripartite tricarboxylate transporter permease n=1 Tax=Desulfosporosinus shakirovi TaxID=2885154 RepID=UPI001E639780|nr:tripartite tricarboxylate transporter permease [Desulfosporosinus sp. SRJS8]MCB8815143.1 tripartite tricarboxylate transporter permease [Desulfosporosinus sp. SRJS8]